MNQQNRQLVRELMDEQNIFPEQNTYPYPGQA